MAKTEEIMFGERKILNLCVDEKNKKTKKEKEKKPIKNNRTKRNVF